MVTARVSNGEESGSISSYYPPARSRGSRGIPAGCLGMWEVGCDVCLVVVVVTVEGA